MGGGGEGEGYDLYYRHSQSGLVAIINTNDSPHGMEAMIDTTDIARADWWQ